MSYINGKKVLSVVKSEEINENAIITKVFKDYDESVGSIGNTYVSFSSGIFFQGKEIHACRTADNHLFSSNSRVVFYIVNKQGGFTKYIVPLDYSTINGDIRDMNLSKSRDGNNLILTFAVNTSGSLYDNWLVVFKKDLTIEKQTKLVTETSEYCFGNVLGTPTGYFLITAYDIITGNIVLYKTSSLRNITTSTMVKVHTFNVGVTINEPCLGYVGNRLVMVARLGASNGTYFFSSNDIEGVTDDWEAVLISSYVVHSPTLPLSQQGSLIIFAGSLLIGNNRQPCIGYYNLDEKKIEQVKSINTNITGWSGCPSLVDLGSGVYGLMYYEDSNFNKTKLWYQRVIPQRVLDMDYFYDYDLGKPIYNHSIVMTRIEGGKYTALVSMSIINNDPTSYASWAQIITLARGWGLNIARLNVSGSLMYQNKNYILSNFDIMQNDVYFLGLAVDGYGARVGSVLTDNNYFTEFFDSVNKIN